MEDLLWVRTTGGLVRTSQIVAISARRDEGGARLLVSVSCPEGYDTGGSWELGLSRFEVAMIPENYQGAADAQLAELIAFHQTHQAAGVIAPNIDVLSRAEDRTELTFRFIRFDSVYARVDPPR